MGLIRKKTATRGAEGGVKYVCDVCSADITSTVRIRCADPHCHDYDLCVLCFSNGEASHNHNPGTHPYRVIEQNSVPIYDRNWGADEELLLLEGAEIYGFGSWADIADHIGGYRDKDEVKAHYQKVYLDSPNFPLPVRASLKDTQLLDEIPREEFQARKKRRIEDRKEAARLAPPAVSKKKPTASVPACHEVQGYMPGRLEFETEYANEAEEAVQLMQFDPGDGINPRTGELEPEMELKITVMDIYNTRLTQRAERKKVIFEHNLLDYKKNSTIEKKRTKEERELLNKAKPFARMMNRDDFLEFCNGLLEEYHLRLAISQLLEWRSMRIDDLRAGEKYEQEKAQRAQRSQPMGSLDRERFASSQRGKPAPSAEIHSVVASYISPDLPIYEKPNILVEGEFATNRIKKSLNSPIRRKHQVVPIQSISPISFEYGKFPDSHLLLPEEIELCEKTRIHPKPYLAIKENILREAIRTNGTLKRRQVKELAKVEPQKGARIFDFFIAHGWLGKA
ncbi:Transcriptional adapter 2 [Erysiphe neolycopersici]|uniref:Transcriptional adapter 2 n=1 Tax=Erysiphe neolycopersici TaxID=212602 RepID=A0A420I4V5_9PEZI|nr:Transcriptional adapter 2 [Erysiphe neolycopersici]